MQHQASVVAMRLVKAHFLGLGLLFPWGCSSGRAPIPEGASTQYSRSLIPKTIREFPKKSGPNIDPKIVGLLFYRTPIYRNSHTLNACFRDLTSWILGASGDDWQAPSRLYLTKKRSNSKLQDSMTLERVYGPYTNYIGTLMVIYIYIYIYIFYNVNT